MQVELSFIVPVTLAVAAIMVVLLTLVVATHRVKVTTGREGIVGETGKAITDVHSEGKVFVHGEYWDAFSENPIEKGKKVKVLRATKDTRLKVEESPDTVV